MKNKLKDIMSSVVNTVKNIIWLYKPYIKHGKLFIILSLLFWCIIIPCAQLVGVYLPSTIVNMLTAGSTFTQIVVCVIIMQCILMFQPVFEDIFNFFCKNKTLSKIDAKLKLEVYEKAVKTDLRYIDDPEYYDNYTWAVSQYAGKASEAQNMVNRITSTVITVISMLAIIGVLSPLAVIVTIVGTIIENLMYIITNHYDVEQEGEIVPYDRKLGYYHRVFYESRYAMDLKSTEIKDYLLEGFNNAQEGKINIIKKFAYKMIPWSLAGNLTFYIARTFVILNIAYGIYVGSIETVGAYITMMASVEALKSALNDLFYYVKDANRLGLYANKIRAFFDVKSEIETQNDDKINAPIGLFALKIENLAFSYDNSAFAIKNITLDIKPGEKIAIVGENGVGKSTLVKLILRFYDAESGGIYINGINIKDYEIKSLRSRIGVAFQNTNIYAMSLYDNINIYSKEKNEKVIDAIERTKLDKVITKNVADSNRDLTREFDDNGIMLSGGETQKIGIARLLAGDFGLLIFDEPSAALDPIAEYEMSELILASSNKATTIVIAHRLSTIRYADKIVLIDNGTIKEVGKHDELMKIKGKYYEMFTKQAENYID